MAYVYGQCTTPLQADACSPATARVAAQTALCVQGIVCAHTGMQNLKTALTSSLGRFRGSDDGVKNISQIFFKI